MPRSWHAPLDLGLVIEFSFVRPQYATGTRHVEIRPILERRIGAFQVDLNPVFARALHGPGVRDGWEFEPAARVAYGDIEKQRIIPYAEWHSELGSLPNLLPGAGQAHVLYFGADLKLARNLLWSPGLGVGLTPAQPRLVIKSRIEFEFGRH
jgi:hypothetical protein